jgi:hypothetical protein
MNFEKVIVAKVAKWLVEQVKTVGLDIDGFNHEITNDFKNHVLKEHGDSEKEKLHGQIAINNDDFDKIAEIVTTPDLAMIGAKRNGQDVLYYIKKMKDGTTIYLEEILDSKKNKVLRGKTMFKRKNDVDKKKFMNILVMNGKTDVSNAKIVEPESTGSNPSCEAN